MVVAVETLSSMAFGTSHTWGPGLLMFLSFILEAVTHVSFARAWCQELVQTPGVSGISVIQTKIIAPKLLQMTQRLSQITSPTSQTTLAIVLHFSSNLWFTQ
jgi:hypothetical protein